MSKSKFRVIKGNKFEWVNSKYHFLEAYVTNTRLMGVIGLYILWKTEDGDTFHQFFHLDAEEYGFDDYMSIYGENMQEVERIIARMMGGLGGDFVSINEKEAKYLVQSFVYKNKKWNKVLPEPKYEYDFILKEEIYLSEEEKLRLWEKICEDIKSYMHLINYFVMRAVGNDEEALAYLSKGHIDYKPVVKPSVLLKNVIEEDKDSYITESLVDVGNHYKMFVSEIKVANTEKGLKVEKAEIKSIMKITSTEAAFGLTRKEHLLVYYVKDTGQVIKLLEQEKPHAMKHSHNFGFLYTEFNPTNDHVNSQVYYLNNDIYGVYYITTSDQLVVAAYSQDKIDEIERYFRESIFKELLELEECMDLDNSLLYEFVNSEYDNIFEFLGEE
ncbi:hypothetical protein FQB35_13415 [Crassaminicella thermophila]|uniref:Uncharacterized protein n=1 Tax=Crassaminicella thermophila TaxID=2599308 RepID=A0A5C0SIZ0_CRATE|nr:hypothetical protein [Crassaminicella thermophila]QEK13188.1 hypothetical protein FQB35_13415 [Crassaminicella thermophila]